jgi:GTPase SAR1 family protein
MAFNITRGVIPTAKKVVIYGPEGIGKSTFASRFPEPVFIDTEGSTKHLDVARFPAPTGWEMLMAEVQEVIANPTLCRTLVIDTADWAEAMCTTYVCEKNHKPGVEDFGYGKGYVYVKEEFAKLLASLSRVVEQGVNVVLTAHAMMRKFEQPDAAGAYDRWELKLSKQVAPLIKEWPDMLLFANYKTIVSDVQKATGKGKVQGGRRVMYASHHPCWDAKNRYGLPDMMDFDYQAIAGIIDGVSTAPTAPVREDRAVVPMSQPKPAEKPATAAAEAEEAPKSKAAAAAKQRQNDSKTAAKTAEPVKAEPPKTEPKEAAQDSPKAETGAAKYVVRGEVLDERLPEPLRSAMTTHDVSEWDLWNVIEARLPGTFPHDSKLWELPREFFAQWAIPNMPKIAAMAKKAREDEEIPFA